MIYIMLLFVFYFLYLSAYKSKFIAIQVPLNGMKAANEGFDLSHNPYQKHTAEHSIWRDDWLFSKGRFK